MMMMVMMMIDGSNWGLRPPIWDPRPPFRSKIPLRSDPDGSRGPKVQWYGENLGEMVREFEKLKVQQWILRIGFQKGLGGPGDPWESFKYPEPETPENHENRIC